MIVVKIMFYKMHSERHWQHDCGFLELYFPFPKEDIIYRRNKTTWRVAKLLTVCTTSCDFHRAF